MDETENFVKFIKEKFSDNEIRMAKFVYETDLLGYTMQTEKIQEILNELKYDKKIETFEEIYSLLEKIVLITILIPPIGKEVLITLTFL